MGGAAREQGSPATAFVFADTAVGGADRRNQVMRFDEFHPPAGSVDCFATWLRFNEDLAAHATVNRSAAGRPSVRGFDGPAYAPSLPLDFDDENDPDAALADARTFVLRLGALFDVPSEAIRPYFSGHKGVHLEVPATLFGGFAPGPDVAARLGGLAARLGEGLHTLDGSIYQTLRLWRFPNTINGRSGLYKIPLASRELLSFGGEEVRLLATSPRTVERVEDDEWDPRPDLVDIWRATAGRGRDRSPAAIVERAFRPMSRGEVDALVALVAPHWTLGRKHDLALSLAGYLAKVGVPEEQALAATERLADDDERPSDRAAAVRDTYARHRAGQPTLGRFGLRKLLVPQDLEALDRLIGGAAGHGIPTLAGKGPVIDVADQDLARGAGAAWAAIESANDPPRLFQFGGLPTRVDRDAATGAHVPRLLSEDRLRHELARAASYVRTTRTGQVSAPPPVAVVRDMLAAPAFPLPVLDAIVEVPAFAPDGSLPAGPGYHVAGRAYYAPASGIVVPPVPDDPTPAQIADAGRLILDDLLGDFPFAGDAERAHALALLLLPFVRSLIDGPTPLHLIEKPTAGTGASLLADVVARIATGRPVAAMTEGRDEDEWRKRLTAKLRDGEAVVLIDNLQRPLDSGNVAAALTAPVWADRILGTSETVRVPIRCAWVATGNNPGLSSEIARRTVRVRLDAKHDRPWLRERFRHPDLIAWAMGRRGDLVGACLTLGRAWLAAGRPVPARLRPLGSYESWSRVLGGVLDVAGVPGFLGNLAEFYERTDAEGQAVRGFLRAWWEKYRGKAVGVAELFAIAAARESGLDLGDKGERSQRIRLGRRLAELRDRHYRLDHDLAVRVAEAGTAKNAQLWCLDADAVGLSEDDPGECV